MPELQLLPFLSYWGKTNGEWDKIIPATQISFIQFYFHSTHYLRG